MLGWTSPRRTSKIVPLLQQGGKEVPPPLTQKLFFHGGILTLSVINAEKYSGTGKVFGYGKNKSSIKIYCGDRLIGKSIIEKTLVRLVGERREKKHEFVGYDSTLRELMITPELPPIVRVVVFDCDRDDESIPLGTVQIPLQHLHNADEHLCTLPIETVNAHGFPSAQGTINLKVTFIPFPSINLSANALFPIPHPLQHFSCHLGWQTPLARQSVPNATYISSLVLFDKNGNFVTGLNRATPPMSNLDLKRYRLIRSKALEGYSADVDEILVDLNQRSNADIIACFVVLSAQTEFSSLKDLHDIYCRIKDARTTKEECRYNVNNIETPATSAILIRLSRESPQSQVGNICDVCFFPSQKCLNFFFFHQNISSLSLPPLSLSIVCIPI
jgi:hypothetical protein